MLAELEDEAGAYGPAREALERLLRLQERRLGTEHAAPAMVLYNPGWIAREQQRPATHESGACEERGGSVWSAARIGREQ